MKLTATQLAIVKNATRAMTGSPPIAPTMIRPPQIIAQQAGERGEASAVQVQIALAEVSLKMPKYADRMSAEERAECFANPVEGVRFINEIVSKRKKGDPPFTRDFTRAMADDMDRRMGIVADSAKLPHKDATGRFVMHNIRPRDLARLTAQKGAVVGREAPVPPEHPSFASGLDPEMARHMDRAMGVRTDSASQLPHKDALGRFVMHNIRPSELRAHLAKTVR